MKDTIYASGAEMRLTMYDNSQYKQSLQALYELVKALNSKGYTDTNWKKCDEILLKTKSILEDLLVNEEAINEVQKELQNTFDNLQFRANNTALIKMLESYETVVQNKNK